MEPGELQTGFSVLQGLPDVLEQANYRVTVTLGRRGAVTELVQVEPGDTTAHAFGLAVDVGTTTVVAQMVDLNTGRTVDVEARYNSQMQVRRGLHRPHHVRARAQRARPDAADRRRRHQRA